jgi:hypothetical protein
MWCYQGKSATAYCRLADRNAGAANKAGARTAEGTFVDALLPLEFWTTTVAAPPLTPSGTCALIWPGLTSCTSAGLPFTSTWTPSSDVGAWVPLKSPPPQVRVVSDSFDP